jgi:hypothetical protein
MRSVFLAVVLVVAALGTARSSALKSSPETTAAAPGTAHSGGFVINPQFDAAGHFSDGLAVVRIGDYWTGKWGYIDRQGTVVITPQFDAAGSFSEGLAEVRVGDRKTGKYGYVDKTGTMVISAQFDGAAPFSEGLAAVRVGDDRTGQYGFIDKHGTMVIAPRFDANGNASGWLPSFSEGLAAVRVGDRYGFIDTRGTMVIAPQFDARFDANLENGGHIRVEVGSPSFSEGLAAVHIGGNETTGRWSYIDHHGTIAIGPIGIAPFPSWPGRFREGLAAVQVNVGGTSKTGFIDKQGRMAIAPQFDWASDFSDGLAVVVMDGYLTGKGFIEKIGKLVIGPRFRLEDLSLGGELTRAKAGFIDRTGRMVVTPQFGGAGSFSDGLAAVAISASPMRTVAAALLGTADSRDKWGYIAR